MAPFLQFMDPDFFWAIFTISGSGNCCVSAVSGSRNYTISMFSGSRIFCPFLQFLDPETAVFLQFLDTETTPFLRFLGAICIGGKNIFLSGNFNLASKTFCQNLREKGNISPPPYCQINMKIRYWKDMSPLAPKPLVLEPI